MKSTITNKRVKRNPRHTQPHARIRCCSPHAHSANSPMLWNRERRRITLLFIKLTAIWIVKIIAKCKFQFQLNAEIHLSFQYIAEIATQIRGNCIPLTKITLKMWHRSSTVSSKSIFQIQVLKVDTDLRRQVDLTVGEDHRAERENRLNQHPLNTA